MILHTVLLLLTPFLINFNYDDVSIFFRNKTNPIYLTGKYARMVLINNVFIYIYTPKKNLRKTKKIYIL